MSDKKQELSEKDKEYYKVRWEASLNNYNYSEKRLDLLIITISGAGIYVCLESLRFMKENDPCSCTPTILLKVAGLILMVGIITNFISQIFGKSANKYDSFMCEHAETNPEKAAKHEEKADKYDKWVTWTNWTSYILLFAGLVTLTLHYLVYL